jgi:hypothetical protein
MKNNIKNIIAIVFLILGPVITFAQGPPAPSPIPDPDFGPGGPIGCNASTGAPVGNGYWVLLALAFAYGIYCYWQLRRSEKSV